tara:strand:+ start:518 stop:736 length:219 start_codon:yes stop_codon:yes gene_type:complete
MLDIYNNNIIMLLLDMSCNILTISDYKTNKSKVLVVDYNKKQHDVSQQDLLDTILYVRHMFQNNIYFKDKTV